MHAVSVTIQLHKMSEVPLACGPWTHGDAILVLKIVRFPAAAESSSSMMDDPWTRLICVAKK